MDTAAIAMAAARGVHGSERCAEGEASRSQPPALPALTWLGEKSSGPLPRHVHRRPLRRKNAPMIAGRMPGFATFAEGLPGDSPTSTGLGTALVPNPRRSRERQSRRTLS